ncbi:MAG TPA: alkaline shock response membrane anchor protein AmaP [Candidatus Omnitrophota bacterium]|nr:alkaline shock response membrane anchor protein AmaP [Candidatus Omnitrophota bacterium]
MLLKKLTGYLYFLVMASAGIVLVMISLEAVPETMLSEAISVVRSDVWSKAGVAAVGAVIFLTGCFVFSKSRKLKGSEKLITFQNPDGEVTVSVSAIENYVKRVSRDIPGIADVKASAKVNKKGIFITSFVAVSAGTNIPEATENIQMTVKSKVQDMLGVEEKITVTMHVVKILKDNEPADKTEDEPERTANPPFRELD